MSTCLLFILKKNLKKMSYRKELCTTYKHIIILKIFVNNYNNFVHKVTIIRHLTQYFLNKCNSNNYGHQIFLINLKQLYLYYLKLIKHLTRNDSLCSIIFTINLN